ncbi:unnamed protein product [Chrysoparadoxa australica]
MGGAVTKDNLAFKMKLAERDWGGVPAYPDRNIVAHYMSPTMPLDFEVRDRHKEICGKSWKCIVQGKATGGNQVARGDAGLVLFCDEFYYRLFQRYSAFKAVFPNMKKRGEVLISAMQFILDLEFDGSKEERLKICKLGERHHTKKGVRPWHFSAYTETLLETIMSWLGREASIDTGEAWSMCVGYVCEKLLSTYLIGQVIPTEYQVNESSEKRKWAAPKAGAGTTQAGEGLPAAGVAAQAGKPEVIPLHVRKQRMRESADRKKKEEAQKVAEAARKERRKSSLPHVEEGQEPAAPPAEKGAELQVIEPPPVAPAAEEGKGRAAEAMSEAAAPEVPAAE